MFGQIALTIIVLLFLTGTGSITVSILLEKKTSGVVQTVEQPPKVKSITEYFSEDSGIDYDIKEEPKKPTSDILESFNMDDYKTLEPDDSLIE